MVRYDVVLEEAHVLRGAAHVGLDGAQNPAVVLPVAGQLLEDQSLLVGFSLQGVYPHRAGQKMKTHNWTLNISCIQII